jgi:hypothetical protein
MCISASISNLILTLYYVWESTLRLFENRALRGIFGAIHKREKVRGNLRKSHFEELQNL